MHCIWDNRQKRTLREEEREKQKILYCMLQRNHEYTNVVNVKQSERKNEKRNKYKEKGLARRALDGPTCTWILT